MKRSLLNKDIQKTTEFIIEYQVFKKNDIDILIVLILKNTISFFLIPQTQF